MDVRRIAHETTDPRARSNLGNVYLLMGRTKEAIKAYDDALSLDPHDDNTRSYLEQARALESGGRAAR